MCQHCVTDGHMTQEELDRRVTAGDRKVIPMDELPLQEFMEALSEMVADAVNGGMLRDEALSLAKDEMDRYYLLRAESGRPVTDAEVAALRAPARDRAEPARWN